MKSILSHWEETESSPAMWGLDQEKDASPPVSSLKETGSVPLI